MLPPPNNLCSSLIVYGSYAPGGENHHVVAHLPGTWRKGKILATQLAVIDEIGPDESDVIPAWVIHFSDCQERLKFRSPERHARTCMLDERWTSLDQAMGDHWARDEMQWWPEECDPDDSDGMIVVNIYLPLKHFPELEDRYDAPPPDLKRDVNELWAHVKSGEKRYEESSFVALIKDARPHRFETLFGDLPDAAAFISKLQRLFRDHALSEGCLNVDSEGRFRPYVLPLERNAASQNELLNLAQRDVAQRAELLKADGNDQQAAILDNARFVFQQPSEDLSYNGSDGQAVDDCVSDAILRRRTIDKHWIYCVSEACYGVAANYDLSYWLMSHWYRQCVDFEPAYEFWKGGGKYAIHEGTCYVDAR